MTLSFAFEAAGAAAAVAAAAGVADVLAAPLVLVAAVFAGGAFSAPGLQAAARSVDDRTSSGTKALAAGVRGIIKLPFTGLAHDRD